MLVLLEFVLEIVEDEVLVLLVHGQQEFVLEEHPRLPLQDLRERCNLLLSLHFLLPSVDVR